MNQENIEKCIKRIRFYLDYEVSPIEFCAILVPEFGEDVVYLAYHAAKILNKKENS